MKIRFFGERNSQVVVEVQCCSNQSLFAGTGKGGNSIWGGKFEDEFHEDLKVGLSAALNTEV